MTPLSLLANQALAWDRVFPLNLRNNNSQPVQVTLLDTDSNCYEGSPPLGENFTIDAHSSYRMTLARVQGHGCNGNQGEFTLRVKPGTGDNGEKTDVHLDFDNGGGLEITPGKPNVYPGTLSAKDPGDQSYTFSMVRIPDVKADAARGSWTLICEGICNRSVAETISNEVRNETKMTDQVRDAIATSLEAGVNFKAISASAKVEMTHERTVGHEMSQSFMRGETNTDTSNFIFTQDDMDRYNIDSVWQWIATTVVKDDTGRRVEVAVVRSNKFTCTPDGDAPTYYPGDPKHLKACATKTQPE
jgi:hypothetical protein